MVDVKEFLKTAGGNWLSADDVVVGDQLEFLGSGAVDEETFDRAYLVMPVKLLRTGEKYNVRLGPRNVSRIAETLGKDTENWVGDYAEVISIEQYKGLGTKGFLLRGAKKAEPPKKAAEKDPAQKPSLWTVHFLRKSKNLIEEDFVLSEVDWEKFVEEEIREELLVFNLVKKEADGYHFTEEAKSYLQ